MWNEKSESLISAYLSPQEFSWKRCKNNASKKQSESLWAMMWQPSFQDALPWNTAILTTIQNLMRTIGQIEPCSKHTGEFVKYLASVVAFLAQRKAGCWHVLRLVIEVLKLSWYYSECCSLATLVIMWLCLCRSETCLTFSIYRIILKCH